MQSRSHRRGGTFLRVRAPSTTPRPPARPSPANPSSIPHAVSFAQTEKHSCKNCKGGPLKKWVAPGNFVWRTRDASPPPSPLTYREQTQGQEPKQVANRRLPSGSPHPPSRVDYQNLRKSIYTPNLLHPTLGLGIGQGLVRTPSPSPLPFHGLLN